MNKAFKELFGPIRAEETLKDHTKIFLTRKTHGYTRTYGMHRYRIYAASCACVLLMILGGRWIYFTPTAQISIDINPSVELNINRFDRVISVNGFNEEGRELSDFFDITYKNYGEAMEQILNYDRIQALLSGDEIMTITVIGSDGRQSAKIFSDVEMYTAKQHNTYCYFAQPEEVAAAHETGLSCGKYRVFLELQLLDPDITPETVQGMTMREIRELIDKLSAESGNDISPYGNRGNGCHGHDGRHGNGRKNSTAE